MKPIRIHEQNEVALMAALDAANGRATAHTMNNFRDLERALNHVEQRLVSASLPKASWKGATARVCAVPVLPNSYRSSPLVITVVSVERRASGWFLTDVERATSYPINKAFGSGVRYTATVEVSPAMYDQAEREALHAVRSNITPR